MKGVKLIQTLAVSTCLILPINVSAEKAAKGKKVCEVCSITCAVENECKMKCKEGSSSNELIKLCTKADHKLEAKGDGNAK